jgi:hypothetical protein
MGAAAASRASLKSPATSKTTVTALENGTISNGAGGIAAAVQANTRGHPMLLVEAGSVLIWD